MQKVNKAPKSRLTPKEAQKILIVDIKVISYRVKPLYSRQFFFNIHTLKIIDFFEIVLAYRILMGRIF